MLAKNNPAEYARLVSGLATPDGKVQLANGDKVARESDWDGGTRSLPSKLLQPTFMEYANGAADYSNTDDKSTLGKKSYDGLFNKQESTLADAVLGKDYMQYDTNLNGGKAKPDKLLKLIKTASEKGKAVPALIKYPGLGGHYVLVTAVKDGRVYYTNPWGQEESMTADAFKAILWGANIPKK